MSQSRYWVFTEFLDEHVQDYEGWLSNVFERGSGKISFICGQQERCPDSERLHIQGYVIFARKTRIGGAKRLLESTSIHLERRRGSHEEAVEYCRKEESRVGDFVSFGEYVDRRRGDNELDTIRKRLREGDALVDIADEHFGLWVRYHKSFELFRSMVVKPRDFKTEVRVYWGPSGVSKSRRATFECGASTYRKPLGEWWDGYDGGSNVIIDDFYGWLRFDELLRCLDRYSHRVPIKGGFVNFAPKLLIITSNDEPRRWYSSEKISDYRFEALTRRFDICEQMVDDWIEPNMEDEQ